MTATRVASPAACNYKNHKAPPSGYANLTIQPRSSGQGSRRKPKGNGQFQEASRSRKFRRNPKFHPPGPNEVPIRHVNGEPVYEKTIKGVKFEWCKKCMRYSTTHNSGTHTGGKSGRNDPDRASSGIARQKFRENSERQAKRRKLSNPLDNVNRSLVGIHDVAVTHPSACRAATRDDDQLSVIWDSGASNCFVNPSKSDFVAESKSRPRGSCIKEISSELPIKGSGEVSLPISNQVIADSIIPVDSVSTLPAPTYERFYNAKYKQKNPDMVYIIVIIIMVIFLAIILLFDGTK